MPFTFIRDEAFSLLPKIIRLYNYKVLSDKKSIFNYRISYVQIYVENGFGILSNKWKIFHKSINANLDLCIFIVKMCCVVHNFVRSRDGFNIKETKNVEGFIGIEQNASEPTPRATNQSIKA